MPGPLSRRRRADRPARPQHALRKVPERLQGNAAGGSRGRASAETCSARAEDAAPAERDRNFRCASSSEQHSVPRETTATGCRRREAASVAGRAGTAHIRGGGGPDHDVSDGEPAFAAGRREEGAGSFQASRRRDHGVWRVAREVGASASARPRSKACRQGGRRSAIDDDVRCAATQDPGSACRGGADAGAGCARGTACVA